MKTFLNILNAIPSVIGAVQTIESALPLPQAGQQKLNLVLGLAGAAYDVAQAGEEIKRGQLLSGVEAITTITVAALNAAGVFSHTSSVSSK
jgi:hypothetical protein